ncbi:hypothetical protein GQF01_09615, partial [Paenibacillus sp. 5J-6]|nr:hypothetical protein [Paenibacillus silvestris]
FTMSPTAKPVTLTVSAIPALFVTVMLSATGAVDAASASKSTSSASLSDWPVAVAVTNTEPVALPSCVMLTVAVVAPAATVAVPSCFFVASVGTLS